MQGQVQVKDTNDYTTKNRLDADLETAVGKLLMQTQPHTITVSSGIEMPLQWHIEVKDGLIKLKCPTLYIMGDRQGGVAIGYKNTRTPDELRARVIWAAGELLERAHVNHTTGVQSKESIDNAGIQG